MGNRYEFIAPCHFGLEAVCKREIADLGYEIVKVEDGKVTFAGDMEALVRANIFLRTTQRILLKVAEFKAVTFEELFQNVKKVPWEEYFPSDARFWVTKATSVKSKLFSTSDIQSIVKKAMVKRMEKAYGKSWFEEDGASFPVRVTFMKDEAVIGLDTTGISLHKRGYRQNTAFSDYSKAVIIAVVILWYCYKLFQYKGISVMFIWVVAICLIYNFITSKTAFGRYFYAIGGNEKATQLSGIDTNKVYFIAYVNMGLLAGLAGLLCAARVGSVNGSTGTSFEMDAIGSCFIGGASAYGGTGTVPGVIVGAVLMGVINLGMSLMGVDQNMQKVVKGLVLLAAVIFDVVSKRGGKLIAKN